MKTLRSTLCYSTAALCALLVSGLPNISLIASESFPTAKVNTTGLAVTDTEVTVGQLHSATGTMAISETGSIQAEQLAIEQINAMGGVLGRKIKIIVEDGASDWPTFAEKAKKLLVNDKVAAVMGCWTSASRKAVLRAALRKSPFVAEIPEAEIKADFNLPYQPRITFTLVIRKDKAL